MIEKTTTQRDYEQRILRVLVHVQQNLDHALDLDELACIANFSPYHFHRVFRGIVGEGVAEHVRRLRVERAAHRLCNTEQPVTQVAFDAGYETHESFTRAFRAMFEMSPTQFRAEHRPRPASISRNRVAYVPEGRWESIKIPTLEEIAVEIRIENRPAMRAAFMRHIGPYQEVGQTWGRFCGWVGQNGLFGPNTKLFGMSHDDPEVTPPDKLRYDACIVVGDDFEPRDDVGVQEVAGGEYAVALHCGPYENFKQTYAAIYGQWIPANGREPADGPAIEVYLNDPNSTKPEDLRTEVCVPLKPKV